MDLRIPGEEAAYDDYQKPDDVRVMLGLLTDYELARALEVTTETLQVWRGRNYGPKPTKLGRRVFYTFADVEKWVHASNVESSVEPSEEPVDV